MPMRIPQDVRDAIGAWESRDGALWYALGIDSNGEIAVKYYDNGESVAVYGRAGKQYCLWSVRRGQRLATYRTARELWTAVRDMIARGPDRFGLAQI